MSTMTLTGAARSESRELAESCLQPGEELLWAGQPMRSRAKWRALRAASLAARMAHVLWLVAISLIALESLARILDSDLAGITAWLSPINHSPLAIAAGFSCLAIWLSSRITLKGVSNAVTNRRALILTISGGAAPLKLAPPETEMHSVFPEDLRRLERFDHRFARQGPLGVEVIEAGDLIFAKAGLRPELTAFFNLADPDAAEAALLDLKAGRTGGGA